MITMRTVKTLAFVMATALPFACSQSDFAGNAAQKSEDRKKGGKDGKDGKDTDDTDLGQDVKDGPDGGGGLDGKDGKDGPGAEGDDSNSLGNPSLDEDGNGAEDSDLIEDDETVLKPLQCTTATIKFASGTTSCPKYYAAYTIDDGKHPNIGCCPLPVKDILSKEAGTPRNVCGPDEVATGTAGGLLVCSRINTKKYKLGPQQKTCYVGNGASGSQGAGPCGAPNVTLQALVGGMGSDACIGQPFGALITAYTSKYCGDMTSAQLYYAKDNQPVPMYLP